MMATIGWIAVAVFFVLPTVVSALKRRYGAAIFGVVLLAGGWYVIQVRDDLAAGWGHWGVAFIGLFAALLLAAVALDYAHPASWWARRFYDEQKLRDAEQRHGDSLRPGLGEVTAMRHYGNMRWRRRD